MINIPSKRYAGGLTADRIVPRSTVLVVRNQGPFDVQRECEPRNRKVGTPRWTAVDLASRSPFTVYGIQFTGAASRLCRVD